MNLKDTYNKIAKDWCQDHFGDSWWKPGAEKFISFLKPGDLVLDAGCGPGHESKFLIDHGLKVIGTDISDKMIGIAKREVPKANFCVMDIRKVDEMSVSFDGIFAKASLLHIPKNETQSVIKNILSRLKPGGYFFIIVKENKDIEEEVVKENDYGYEYERFFSYYSMEEIKNYFRNLKMKIVFAGYAKSSHTNWIQVIAQK